MNICKISCFHIIWSEFVSFFLSDNPCIKKLVYFLEFFLTFFIWIFIFIIIILLDPWKYIFKVELTPILFFYTIRFESSSTRNSKSLCLYMCWTIKHTPRLSLRPHCSKHPYNTIYTIYIIHLGEPTVLIYSQFLFCVLQGVYCVHCALCMSRLKKYKCI